MRPGRVLWLRLALQFGIPPAELQERLSPTEFREYQALTDYLYPIEDGWRQAVLVASAMTRIKDPESVIPIRRMPKAYTEADQKRDIAQMKRLFGIK